MSPYTILGDELGEEGLSSGSDFSTGSEEDTPDTDSDEDVPKRDSSHYWNVLSAVVKATVVRKRVSTVNSRTATASSITANTGPNAAQTEPQVVESTGRKVTGRTVQVVKYAVRISEKELRRTEQVMKLPQHSLDRHVKLAMDVVRLMDEHDIPADLLRYDGAADHQTSHKIKILKKHVQEMLSMVASVVLEDDPEGAPDDDESVGASVSAIVAKHKSRKKHLSLRSRKQREAEREVEIKRIELEEQAAEARAAAKRPQFEHAYFCPYGLSTCNGGCLRCSR